VYISYKRNSHQLSATTETNARSTLLVGTEGARRRGELLPATEYLTLLFLYGIIQVLALGRAYCCSPISGLAHKPGRGLPSIYSTGTRYLQCTHCVYVLWALPEALLPDIWSNIACKTLVYKGVQKNSRTSLPRYSQEPPKTVVLAALLPQLHPAMKNIILK